MRFLVSFLVLAAAACASAPEDRAAARPATQAVRIVDGGGGVTTLAIDATRPSAMMAIAVPPDQVWRTLPVVYESLGLPIESMDSRTRQVGTNSRVRARIGGVRLSQYLDCGRTQGGPSADTYDVHLAVETRVRAEGENESRVSTLVEATARPSSFAAQTIRCSSTGVLETRILEGIASRAQGSSP